VRELTEEEKSQLQIKMQEQMQEQERKRWEIIGQKGNKAPLSLPRFFFAIVAGGVLGGAIGLFGAPPWEMAGLVVGPVGAITGALAAGCAARSTKGVLASAFVTVVCAAGMASYLAKGNPSWVIITCTIVVVAAGAAAAVCGFLFGLFVRIVLRDGGQTNRSS